PISPNSADFSMTWTRQLRRASAQGAGSPPMPPPAMRMGNVSTPALPPAPFRRPRKTCPYRGATARGASICKDEGARQQVDIAKTTAQVWRIAALAYRRGPMNWRAFLSVLAAVSLSLSAHAEDAKKTADDFAGRWVAAYNSGDAA